MPTKIPFVRPAWYRPAHHAGVISAGLHEAYREAVRTERRTGARP